MYLLFEEPTGKILFNILFSDQVHTTNSQELGSRKGNLFSTTPHVTSLQIIFLEKHWEFVNRVEAEILDRGRGRCLKMLWTNSTNHWRQSQTSSMGPVVSLFIIVAPPFAHTLTHLPYGRMLEVCLIPAPGLANHMLFIDYLDYRN